MSTSQEDGEARAAAPGEGEERENWGKLLWEAFTPERSEGFRLDWSTISDPFKVHYCSAALRFHAQCMRQFKKLEEAARLLQKYYRSPPPCESEEFALRQRLFDAISAPDEPPKHDLRATDEELARASWEVHSAQNPPRSFKDIGAAIRAKLEGRNGG